MVRYNLSSTLYLNFLQSGSTEKQLT